MPRLFSLVPLLAGLLGACAVPLSAQRPPVPTADDIAAAMADTVHGWFSYRSDGRPISDTARRMAALSMWDWEGGDRQRGLRLLYAAYQRGVADSVFYSQAAFALITFRRDSEAVVVAQTGLARWPGYWPLWAYQADALRHLGDEPRAQAARMRADSLRRLEDAFGADAP